MIGTHLKQVSTIAVLAVGMLIVSMGALKVAAVQAKTISETDEYPRLMPVAAPTDCTDILPGQSVIEGTESSSIPADVDITNVSTTLNGQWLTTTFVMESVPGSGLAPSEIVVWEVYIDADNSRTTGLEFGEVFTDGRQGADYAIIGHRSATTDTAELWQLGRTGRQVMTRPTSLMIVEDSFSDVMVSALITDTGVLTGVRPNSRLVFRSAWLDVSYANYDDVSIDAVHFDQFDCIDPAEQPDFTPTSDTVASISNAFLRADVGSTGAFVIGTTGGSTGINDTNKRLMYGFTPNGNSYPGTSFATLQIDSTDYVFHFDAPDTGPSQIGQTIVSAWDVTPSIAVSQTLSFVENPFTDQEDLVIIEYTVTNQDEVSHDIGLRLLIDLMIGNNDDAPFLIPDVGPLITEQIFPNATAIDLPEHFTVFESDFFANDSLRGFGVLDDIDIGLSPPDQAIFGNWLDMQETDWAYDPLIDEPLGDSAVALYWNPLTLDPGASQTFSTAYGLPDADIGVAGDDPDWLDAKEEAFVPEDKDSVEIKLTYWVYNNTGQDLFYDLDIPLGLITDGPLELLPEPPAQQSDGRAAQRPRRTEVSQNDAAERYVSARYGGDIERLASVGTVTQTETISYTLVFTFEDRVFTESSVLRVVIRNQPNIPIYLPIVLK